MENTRKLNPLKFFLLRPERLSILIAKSQCCREKELTANYFNFLRSIEPNKFIFHDYEAPFCISRLTFQSVKPVTSNYVFDTGVTVEYNLIHFLQKQCLD